MFAPPFVVVALVAGGLLIGCGGDDDDEGGAGGSKQEQSGDLTRAAQRLETYLKKNTKDLSGQQAPRGQVVRSVEPVEGKLKITALLNEEAVGDEAPAREVCRVARKSGMPEARGAELVDAGDVLIQRC
jgi:hypothetical protein